MEPRIQTKPLVQSLVLATILVLVAFGAISGEPRNLDPGTQAILIANFGLPYFTMWLARRSGFITGNIFPTWLLMATGSAHYVFLVAFFYTLQVRFDRWRTRRIGLSA